MGREGVRETDPGSERGGKRRLETVLTAGKGPLEPITAGLRRRSWQELASRCRPALPSSLHGLRPGEEP